MKCTNIQSDPQLAIEFRILKPYASDVVSRGHAWISIGIRFDSLTPVMYKFVG